MVATSLAVVRCSSASGPSSSPVQLTKWVCSIPSSAARAFIRVTKAASLPATCSARAVAQSLAELTTTDLSISSMESCAPSSR